MRLYYSAATKLVSLGGVTVAITGTGGRAVEKEAATILDCCSGIRSEDELVSEAAARTGVGPERMRVAIGELHRCGLLRELRFQPGASAARAPDEISVVAVVTADRPRYLARCLEDMRKACERHCTWPEVLVVDNSVHDSSESRNVVAQFRRRWAGNAYYVGRAEAARLPTLLGGSPDGRRMVKFSMTPGEIGCGRNVAMALTLGRTVLMIDDDIRWIPWRPPGYTASARLAAHRDPRVCEFFESRHASTDVREDTSIDLLAEHNQLLRLDLTEWGLATRTSEELRPLCRHLVDMVTGTTRGRVRATFSGLAGDSARYCPFRLLSAVGGIEDALADPQQLATAMTFREIRCVARHAVAVHDAHCMSYCMALDLGDVVPPFAPLGRGEDSVFGVLMSYIDPSALNGHVPVGILHDSPRESRYPNGWMPSGVETRIADVTIGCLGRIAQLVTGPSPAERMRAVGRALQALIDVSHAEFLSLLVGAATDVRSSHVAGALRRRIGSSVPVRLEAIDRYVRMCSASFARPDFFAPAEWVARGLRTDEACAAAREWLAAFGRCLEWWPELWTRAPRDLGAFVRA